MAQTNISVCNEALNLMELSKMGGVQGLITENAINREVFHGLEALL
jgi:hypothetical protein